MISCHKRLFNPPPQFSRLGTWCPTLLCATVLFVSVYVLGWRMGGGGWLLVFYSLWLVCYKYAFHVLRLFLWQTSCGVWHLSQFWICDTTNWDRSLRSCTSSPVSRRSTSGQYYCTLSACYSIVLVIGIWMVERTHTMYCIVFWSSNLHFIKWKFPSIAPCLIACQNHY